MKTLGARDPCRCGGARLPSARALTSNRAAAGVLLPPKRNESSCHPPRAEAARPCSGLPDSTITNRSDVASQHPAQPVATAGASGDGPTGRESTSHGGAARGATGPAAPPPLPLKRRTVLLRSLALPVVLASLTAGSDDPTTLLNSVLAGYGLPKLPGSTGFKLLDDFELEFTLEYPRSWVVRPNTLRQGVYISDFNTADKLSVEVFQLTPGSDLVMAAVAAAVVPGAGAGQQDDKLLLPPASRVKSRTEQVDGKEYTYLEFPSETVTRSGYQIRRKNFAVAGVKRGTVYTLNASSRTDEFNKDKEALLRHVVESFRVR